MNCRKACRKTNHGFLYILLCRLSQDALENFFFTIRLKNPTLKPTDFKSSAIRNVSLAQLLRPSPNGSWMDGEKLAGIKNSAARQQPTHVLRRTAAMLERSVVHDTGAFEYLSGHIVGQVKNTSTHAASVFGLHGADKSAEEYSSVLQLVSPAKQDTISDSHSNCTWSPQNMGGIFWHNEKALLENRSHITALNKAILKVRPTTVPGCHGMSQELTKCFLHIWVHLYFHKPKEKISKELSARGMAEEVLECVRLPEPSCTSLFSLSLQMPTVTLCNTEH